VILVSHSYSGMPASEACDGFGRKQRAAEGLSGGIVRLVYIQALAVSEGFCVTKISADFPDWMGIDREVRSRTAYLDSVSCS
jgi:hypothetical protein